jgi:hypothetical protein
MKSLFRGKIGIRERLHMARNCAGYRLYSPSYDSLKYRKKVARHVRVIRKTAG